MDVPVCCTCPCVSFRAVGASASLLQLSVSSYHQGAHEHTFVCQRHEGAHAVVRSWRAHLRTWVCVEGKGTWASVLGHMQSFPLQLSSKAVLISNYFTVQFKGLEMSKGKLKITYQIDNLLVMLVTSQKSCSPKGFHITVSLGGRDCQQVEYFT